MKFNNREKQWILNNYVGKTSLDIANDFNREFKKNITKKQIQNFKKSRHLKSGINTQFKKNQIPYNKKKIGDEFVSGDGYTYIKISEPDKWVLKQRYIYEENVGKIPKGHSVIFADSDKTNFKKNNLILVSDRDKLIAKNQLLIFEDAELTKTGLLIAKLINETHDKSK